MPHRGQLQGASLSSFLQAWIRMIPSMGFELLFAAISVLARLSSSKSMSQHVKWQMQCVVQQIVHGFGCNM